VPPFSIFIKGNSKLKIRKKGKQSQALQKSTWSQKSPYTGQKGKSKKNSSNLAKHNFEGGAEKSPKLKRSKLDK